MTTNLPWQKTGRIWWLALFTILVSTPSAWAQQAQPESYRGFDGQQISDVDVSARPGVDVAHIRSLIKHQKGAAFSSGTMQQTVAALEQSRLFSRVRVSVEPEAAGLRIIFILEPTDYVGVIEFPGTGTHFPYTALLQAVDISEQTPFYEGLEPKGRDGLLNYLHKQGYFAAEVQPTAQEDPQKQIVNLSFRCDLKKQARIRNITFAGLPDEQSSSMRASLHGVWARLKRVSLKPGQRYSESRADKLIDFIRDRLRTENRLAPAVHLGPPAYDAATNVVDLRFNIVPGPQVSLKVNGARVSSKTLRRLISIYQEGSADQDLIDEGERNLRSYFQTKGYFYATTNSQVTKQGDAVQIVYNVDLGSKSREKGVYFEGNHYFSDKQLKARVAIKKGFLILRGAYSDQLLQKSVGSLAQLYKDAGFSSVSIRTQVQNFRPEVDVTFQITEGPQDKLASLQLSGNKTRPLGDLTKQRPLTMKMGEPFSPKRMETDRTELLASYLDLGYLNADIRSSATPKPDNPHEMNVVFTVQEGPQVTISNIVLLGEKHTKPQFLDGIIAAQLKPSNPLSEGKLLRTESDLYDLGIFDWASTDPLRAITDQTSEEVLVKVHESPLNSIDIGGGLEIMPRDGSLPANSVAVPGFPPISLGSKFTVSQKSYIGPRFTFDFERHNLRGKAQTATIGTILSRLDQRGFFTYADPHFHGTSWSSLLSASGERTSENPIYTAELGQASFQIQKSLDRRHTRNVILRYTFNRTDLYNILITGLVLPEDQHVRLSTFDAEYVRDSRDKPLDAHHGIYQTFDFGVTAKSLGASADFLRFLGQTAFYKPVKPWLIWANNFRIGLAKPFSGSDVPLSERFFSGGADSLRGFPINGAGPQRPVPVCSNPSNPSTCTLISVPVGGDMLFIFNSEARFPLPIYHGIGGAVFYDGGNVYSNINLRQFADDFTHSVGVGLRYQTPVGPVRLDFGYRITSVPGVKDTQYFVTLGQSF